MTVSDALRAFAEDADAHIRAVPHIAPHIRDSRFVVMMSPSPAQSVTSRVRTTAAELDDTIADVRAALRAFGFRSNVWHVGPSSRPEGLAALLRARGFIPAVHPPYEPTMTAMALGAPPPVKPDAAIEARIARSLDEYVAGLEIAFEAFDTSADERADWMAAAPRVWASQDGEDRFTHVVYLEGQPAGVGFSACGSTGILMGGAGVLPAARGRGVYRALLAARWAEVERLGKEGLVIQAGAMSRPILERCGFQIVCTLQLFEDAGLHAGPDPRIG